MLLSIGMIVKNEEKCLRQCLEGVKPILERVHSELIIADTGSTDKTMEIAREYTNNVYQIEWRDDFAWARNTTLDKARGKWFMFLDADEVFEDTRDLIEFFNSGEYEKYKSAQHGMIILTNGEKSENTSKRLFKISKNVRFTGKIHEYPENTTPPLKELKSYSVHSGYFYEDNPEGAAKRETKFRRNIEPLLEMYEEHPDDIRVIVQIVKEYSTNNKTTECLKFLDIGISVGERIPRSVFYDYLRLMRADYYRLTRRFEEAVEDVRDYFSNVKKLYTLAINMRLAEAISLKALGRLDEAAEAYKQTWTLYEKNDLGNIDHADLDINSSRVLSNEIRNSVPAELINYYSNEGDIENVLAWGGRSVFGTTKALDLFMKAQSKNLAENGFIKAPKLYNLLTSRFGADSTEYKTGVEALEKAVPDAEAKARLAEALVNGCTGDSTDYMKLQRLRFSLANGDSETTDGALAYFIGSDKAFSEMYGDVIAAAITRGVDFSPFINKMGIDAAIASVPGIVRTNEGLVSLVSDYVLECLSDEKAFPLKTARVLRELLRNILAAGVKDGEETVMAFEAYVSLYRQYLSRVYSAEILTDELCGLLTEPERFAYFAGKAYECKEGGDYVKFVANLREAVEKDNVLSGAVMTVISKFQRVLDEDDRKAREKRERQDLLNRETAALKKAIISLINNNEKGQAAQILSSYEQINPSDPEIGAIKKMLE